MNLFGKKERQVLPQMYYREKRFKGKKLSESDFPPDTARKIFLFAQRLHDVGASEDDKRMCLSVPKMIGVLVNAGILDKIPAPGEIDTVLLVFGRGYAGWWHLHPSGEQLLIPEQIILYHENRNRNFFISQLPEGLDLCENSVRSSDTDNPLLIADRVSTVGFDIKLTAELRTVFHLTFLYLKYRLALKKTVLGYKDYIHSLSVLLPHGERAERLTEMLTQYFALRIGETELPEVYDDVDFGALLRRGAEKSRIGCAALGSSFNELCAWAAAVSHSVLAADNPLVDRIDQLRALEVKLRSEGLCLWLIHSDREQDRPVLLALKSDAPSEAWDVVRNASNGSRLLSGMKFEPFDETALAAHEEALLTERCIRNAARSIYPLLDLPDISDLFAEIGGETVFEDFLYKRDRMICAEEYEDEIGELVRRLLLARGKERSVLYFPADGYDADRRYFRNDRWVTSIDRFICFSETVRQSGFLMFFPRFEDDFCHVGLIRNDPAAIESLRRGLDLAAEAGDIVGYRLLEGDPLFEVLLESVEWIFTRDILSTAGSVRSQLADLNTIVGESPENDGTGGYTPEALDEYLSRVCVPRRETAVVYYLPESETERYITVNASNGKGITNLDLIRQIQNALSRDPGALRAMDRSTLRLNRLTLRDDGSYQLEIASEPRE